MASAYCGYCGYLNRDFIGQVRTLRERDMPLGVVWYFLDVRRPGQNDRTVRVYPT
jgi:hypothetical protein